MLIIRVLHPAGDDGLVRQVEGVLEVEKPRDQPRRCRWPSNARREETGPLSLEKFPVDQLRQLHQLVARIDHVGQAGTQEVILIFSADTRLHHGSEIAVFQDTVYDTLQSNATVSAQSSCKFSRLGVDQRELNLTFPN